MNDYLPKFVSPANIMVSRGREGVLLEEWMDSATLIFTLAYTLSATDQTDLAPKSFFGEAPPL